MADDYAQCPRCGWAGKESDFEVEGNERKCSVCEHLMKRV